MDWKLGLCVVAGIALVGCGGPSETGGAEPGADVANLKQAPPGIDAPAGKLEVVAFKGGYNIDFYAKAASEFDAENPGLTTTVSGNPRVWEQLRPRMVGGTPPDLMYPGWDLDIWGLVAEGQLMLLDKALDSPAYHKGPLAGEVVAWRDTFNPAILKLGAENGHQYVLPYFFSLWGWWYDPGVFAKNGWQPPKTYDELLVLCEKIKAAGMAPITFQGQYPYYMLQGMLLPWAQSAGGIEVINNAQNLVPGAWRDPAILKAAQMICELRDKGFFQEGAVGLSHTESQSSFLKGKAAMIPCGTWLDSEMRDSKPAGAQMRYMLPPLVKDGKGDPTAVTIEIEPWMVPAEAKNPNAAVALFKYMTSLPKAKQFVEEKATLMAIKGSEEAKVPETLVVPRDVFNQSKTVYSFMSRQWYAKLEKEIEGALTSMLNGKLTAEEFCERVEQAAQKTRDDQSIVKHKL